MAHTCHAIDCNVKIIATMFMCKKHWFMVSWSKRQAIWDTYRPGQCDDWNITKEYAEAAKNAICYVAQKEGKIIDMNCDKLKLYDHLLIMDAIEIPDFLRRGND